MGVRRDIGRFAPQWLGVVNALASARGWLSLCWLVTVTACAPHRSAVATSGNKAAAVVASAPAFRQPSRCEQAAERRLRVVQLLREGRLNRTLRVIDDANRLCPETARQTWAAQVLTLAEIGRYQAASDLAHEILADAPNPELRAAAEQATQLVAQRAVSTKDDPAALTGNGQSLAAAGLDAKLAGDKAGAQRLFDRAIEALERQYGVEARVEERNGFSAIAAIAESPTEPLLALADGAAVVVVDVTTSSERLRLEEPEGKVTAVAFSPDGRSLISSGGNVIRLWRSFDGVLLRTFTGHQGAVTSVAFVPDGKTFASGSADQTVRLWQLSDAVLLRTLEGHKGVVTSVAFARDGRTLASGSEDHTVRLWRVPGGKLLGSIRNSEGKVTSVAFAPNGTALASGSDDHLVRLWNPESGGLIRTLKGHALAVNSVAFSPDGKTVAAGALDRTVRLWDVRAGKLVRTYKGSDSPRRDVPSAFAFSRVGRRSRGPNAFGFASRSATAEWERVT